MRLRTEDREYGEQYWSTLDNGAGYQDSLMWSDIAHIIFELWGVDREAGRDVSLERSVLDVGCAMGWLLVHLRKRGFNVRGVDYSTYALAQAPAEIQYYCSWFDLSGEETLVEHERRQFDLVTCFETMEHIEESAVDSALVSISNAVAPGGEVLLTICTSGQPGWDSDPTHVTIRDRDWWTERLAAAGLERNLVAEERIRQFWLFSRHDGVFVGTPSI